MSPDRDNAARRLHAIKVIHTCACPLTAVAARYTSDRADNFDIYLPLWLARYNKRVFGSLFVAGLIFSAWQWLRWSGS